MSKFNPQKNTTEFIQHLEMGVEEMGWNFMDFFPTPVTMSNGEDGYIFSQVKDCENADHSVCVLNVGITFPEPNKTTIMFSKEQPPSIVAILFLTSMIKGEIINPQCPSCSKKQ